MVLGVLLGFLVVSFTLVSLSAKAWPIDLREPPFRVLIGVEELRVAICEELTCAHGVAALLKDERGGRPGRAFPDPKPVSTTGGSCQPV